MATFGLQQPAQQATGFDCELVNKSPEAVQSECPICLQVLREPYQISCCGYSYCKACIQRIKTDKQACPTCKKRQFDIFPNKGLQRSLYGFQVYCSHKKEGCEWKGELGQLDNHLNLSPQPDKQLEGCEYSEIKCIYCSELVKRSKIVFHQDDICPKHPLSCEYCKSYKSHYEDVVINHWPVCGYHPVRCPNECDTTLRRQALENHVTKDCPKTVIDCDFHHVGCNVKLRRKDMPAHLNADMVTHMSLQAASYKQLREKTNRLERGMETLTQEVATMQQDNQQIHVAMQDQELKQQIAKLQTARKTLSSVMLPIAKYMSVRPKNSVDYTMERYHHRNLNGLSWFSEPFFSHPGGYKLCLRVDANGNGRGEDTHVSVFIHLMKGEFDKHLKWPMRGKFSVQILNRKNRGKERRVKFRTDLSRRRVMDREMSEYGANNVKFISQRKAERKYVTNDCLNFRVTCANTY